MGILKIHIPITKAYSTTIDAEVSGCDVPLLLGLDEIKALRAILDFDEEIIASKSDGWGLLLTRKLGHAFIEWDGKLLYTESELKQLNRRFMHLHSDKFTAMLRRADTNSVTPNTHAKLEHVNRHCDVCQREANEPGRIRVSIPHHECISIASYPWT